MRGLTRHLVAAAALTAMPGTGLAGDPDAGRDLARLHCTRCHIVGDLNTMGIGSTPSFQFMVNNVDDFDQRFLSFYALRPHPAFVRVENLPTLNDIPPPIVPIELTVQDIEDIAAFAATLRQK